MSFFQILMQFRQGCCFSDRFLVVAMVVNALDRYVAFGAGHEPCLRSKGIVNHNRVFASELICSHIVLGFNLQLSGGSLVLVTPYPVVRTLVWYRPRIGVVNFLQQVPVWSKRSIWKGDGICLPMRKVVDHGLVVTYDFD